MLFRQAGGGDAEAVEALYREVKAGENCCWENGYPDETFVRFDLDEGGLFVLEEKGMLIGAVSLIAHDDLDELPVWRYGRSCVLARLCVRPDRQGKGLGRLMTERVCAEGTRRGYESVRLLADVRNEMANRLYRRLGFEERGTAVLYGHRYRTWERRAAL